MQLEWKQLRKIGISIFVLFLAIYYWSSVAGLISTMISALYPVFMGAAIAYVINLLMDLYEDYFFPKSRKDIIGRIRRPVCLLGAVVTILIIIGALIYLVIPELLSSVEMLVNGIPHSLRELSQNKFLKSVLPDDVFHKLMAMDWNVYIGSVLKFLKGGFGGIAGSVISVASSVFANIISAVLGIIFALYFLAGKETFQHQSLRVLRVVIKEKYYDKLLHYLHITNECFHQYIVGKLLDALVIGLMCGVGMALLRLPYAVMIGTIVGFTALIPVAGAYFGAVVGAVIIMTVSPAKALFFLIFILIVQQIEGNLIYPKLMSGSIGLPGVWVLAAVTAGGSLAGILGMLIGVPIVASVYKIVRERVIEREEKLGLEPLPEIVNSTQERWQKIKSIKNKKKK